MSVVFWFGEHREDPAHEDGFYTPRCTKGWQKALAGAWRREFGDDIIFVNENVEVKVEFFFRNSHGADVDNLLRRCLNALNGLAWSDDAQVVKVTAERIHNAERSGVRIEISAYTRR